MKNKKNTAAKDTKDKNDYLGCLGEFNAEDRICLKYCAISLRCAIESNIYLQSEILEEMYSTETATMNNQ
jgi:hypothetical protein